MKSYVTIIAATLVAFGCERGGSPDGEPSRSTAEVVRSSAQSPVQIDATVGARSTPEQPARRTTRASLVGLLGGIEHEPHADALFAIESDPAALSAELLAIYEDESAEPIHRMRALAMMRHTGQEAAGAYEAILLNAQTPVMFRRIATRAFATAAGPAARGTLTKLLNDSDSYTRAAAVLELRGIGDEGAIAALTKHARIERSEHVRWHIERSLTAHHAAQTMTMQPMTFR